MAQGDLRVFNEALAYLQDGGFEPTDDIKVAILDNTVTPAIDDVAPDLGDYTEVGTAGTYVAGGISIGNLGDAVSESGGTMKFDSATNPSWAQDASNDVDAWWALVYNVTDAGNRAIAFVELGGPVNMTAGDLQVTWNGSGLYTVAR